MRYSDKLAIAEALKKVEVALESIPDTCSFRVITERYRALGASNRELRAQIDAAVTDARIFKGERDHDRKVFGDILSSVASERDAAMEVLRRFCRAVSQASHPDLQGIACDAFQLVDKQG